MKKKGYFIIPFVIYPFDIMVSYKELDSEISNRLLNFGIDKENIEPVINLPDNCLGRCVLLPSNQTVLRLFDKNNHGVIAHEIFHAVSFILDRIGTPLTIGVSDESYAYLIQYVTYVVYEKLTIFE